MAHQALARTWRPHNFTQIVGQEHVVRALTHGLENERTHHAYLFTGTRGVGKTTLARILAKALNCDARQGANPCGQCSNCLDIDAGRFVDLLEVDAASRTKVEDTRDLLDNVQYAPTRGRFKIYLIDEVHMLSTHSFNALLKTLEEPPAHVKFLLATTDPQKLPVTVLSRCLQFNLKNLTPDQIRAQMSFILESEKIAFEANALRPLARSADGSMRDGLSLLDQAIAHGAGQVLEADVNAMLGTLSKRPLLALLEAIAAHDAKQLLLELEQLAGLAANFAEVLQHLMETLHQLGIAQLMPDHLKHEDDAEQLTALAHKIAAEDIQLYYQIALTGQRDLAYAPDARTGVEMALLRMLLFRPVRTTSTAPSSSRSSTPHTTRATADAAPATLQRPASSPAHNREAAQHPVQSIPAPQHKPDTNDWHTMVQRMALKGMAGQLANHCSLHYIDETTCELRLDTQYASLQTTTLESQLQKALQQLTGNALKLKIITGKSDATTPAQRINADNEDRLRQAEQDLKTDATIIALQNTMDARIIPGSIRPPIIDTTE